MRRRAPASCDQLRRRSPPREPLEPRGVEEELRDPLELRGAAAPLREPDELRGAAAPLLREPDELRGEAAALRDAVTPRCATIGRRVVPELCGVAAPREPVDVRGAVVWRRVSVGVRVRDADADPSVRPLLHDGALTIR